MQDLIMFDLDRMMADMLNYNSKESNDDKEEEEVGTRFYDLYNGATTGAEKRNPCTCPQCVMDRIIGFHRCCNEGLDSDDDDHHHNDTKKDDNSNHDNNRDNNTPLDCSASPCAICMEPETRKRGFSYLPCCSGSRVNPSPPPTPVRRIFATSVWSSTSFGAVGDSIVLPKPTTSSGQLLPAMMIKKRQ
mmetsp:Transcript_2005/g.4345  ORF Transcript_2005/g.4345 Transcript_2005/m.4345 type:complete len:189 (+) Transcript_2005:230-796(+)